MMPNVFAERMKKKVTIQHEKILFNFFPVLIINRSVLRNALPSFEMKPAGPESPRVSGLFIILNILIK